MSDERDTAPGKPLEVGDRVNWLRSSRGGYGFITPIAAVVRKIGPKRIQVLVAQRIAGAWQTKACWVEADSLTPRVAHVPEVDIAVERLDERSYALHGHDADCKRLLTHENWTSRNERRRRTPRHTGINFRLVQSQCLRDDQTLLR